MSVPWFIYLFGIHATSHWIHYIWFNFASIFFWNIAESGVKLQKSNEINHYFSIFESSHGRMVGGLTTTCAISRMVVGCIQCQSPLTWVKFLLMMKCTLYFVIKFVSDLWQIGCFIRVHVPSAIKLTSMIFNWYIVESWVKHYNRNPFIVHKFWLPYWTGVQMQDCLQKPI